MLAKVVQHYIDGAESGKGDDMKPAFHTLLAKGEKVPEDVIETARAVGSYEDPKLEALRVFTLNLVENRGWTSPEGLEAFLATGFAGAVPKGHR